MILVNMKYVDCRLGGMWLSVGGFRSWRVGEFEGFRVNEFGKRCWFLVLSGKILWMWSAGFGIRVFLV
ncbi:hypothetical protein SAMN05421594_4179 [Chryseobacterium oleae]|uniref:Uncharacterized protein n=1 Tax=Chryseobacterium oleae TaxID=491207 RepID=A0A1I5BTR4_CHROL|nr:hypothetical protein SAMN05421594_4179 [Chryseobacterium oleae]